MFLVDQMFDRVNCLSKSRRSPYGFSHKLLSNTGPPNKIFFPKPDLPRSPPQAYSRSMRRSSIDKFCFKNFELSPTKKVVTGRRSLFSLPFSLLLFSLLKEVSALIKTAAAPSICI